MKSRRPTLVWSVSCKEENQCEKAKVLAREAGITKARLSSASAVGRRTFYLKNYFPAREFEKIRFTPAKWISLFGTAAFSRCPATYSLLLRDIKKETHLLFRRCSSGREAPEHYVPSLP